MLVANVCGSMAPLRVWMGRWGLDSLAASSTLSAGMVGCRTAKVFSRCGSCGKGVWDVDGRWVVLKVKRYSER